MKHGYYCKNTIGNFEKPKRQMTSWRWAHQNPKPAIHNMHNTALTNYGKPSNMNYQEVILVNLRCPIEKWAISMSNVGGSYQESDRVAVKDERSPAAWAGNMSPNLPTCPSVNIDPSLRLSPNLLPAWNYPVEFNI